MREVAQILPQPREISRICLESVHVTVRSNQPCSKIRVISDVRTQIEEHVSGPQHFAQSPRDVRLVAATPHLPMNAVAQVNVEFRTFPKTYFAFISFNGSQDRGRQVNESKLTGKRRQRSKPALPPEDGSRISPAHEPVRFVPQAKEWAAPNR